MSHIDTLRRALQGRRPGSMVTIDHVRGELDAAQVPPSQYGGLFAEACHKGLLKSTGLTRPSLHRPARGRRVQVYVVLDQRTAVAA